MFQILSIFVLIACLTEAVPRLCACKTKIAIRQVIGSVFTIYLIGNLYCTIFSRVPNTGGKIDLRPFKTYVELFKESVPGGGETTGLFAWFMKDTTPLVGIILNILLYYPLGYLLPILFSKLEPKYVIFISCLGSIATEIIQYLLKMGWCETDDVIHNTLGASIGLLVWRFQKRNVENSLANKGERMIMEKSNKGLQ